MMKLLLLYTSHEGQTEKIVTRIRRVVRSHFECDCVKLADDLSIDLNNYHAIIVASSIRYGFYHKRVKQFIKDNYSMLNQMYGAFLGVNMLARKPNKNTPETNVYTRKFLKSIPWFPKMSVVFAGALYYPQYRWFDKQMIRFIMWLTKGDTDIRKPVIEYTDWDKVVNFAQAFKNNCLNTLK